MEIGFRYAAKVNQPRVRGAALRLLGSVGKDDSRVFPMIAENLTQALDRPDFPLAIASAEALISLGDPRGVALFDQLSKQAEGLPRIQGLIGTFQERLMKKLQEAAKHPAG